MTKQLIKRTAALAMGFALTANFAFAGGKTFKQEVAVEEAPPKWWTAQLSTGYDSLYMFRGVNVLRGDKSYGAGIYWDNANVSFNLTPNDTITLGAWMGFGLNNVNYQEFDASISYTHTFGNLALSGGYTFYDVWSSELYSHELNIGAAYKFDLGFMTLTPGLRYYYNIGPDSESSGIISANSSFLLLRVDGAIPVYNKGAISINPWVSLGANFEYNLDANGNSFNGLNNLELGLTTVFQISKYFGISPYVAFSQVVNSGGLLGTRDSTFWAGAAATLTF